MSTVKSSSENLTLNADGVGSDVVIQNNGTESVRILSSNNVLFNGSVVIDNGIADGGEVQFRSAGYNDWNQDNYNGDLRFFHTGIVYSTITSSGDFKFNSGYGSAATAYGVRAWVNFNGTGTVSIRSSGNVSSITDQSTGQYVVNLATAMPDTNYSTTIGANYNVGGTTNWVRSFTTSSFVVASYRVDTLSYADTDTMTVNVAR